MWLDRMKARPAYVRGMERWFNADYLSLSAAKGEEARDAIMAMIAA